MQEVMSYIINEAKKPEEPLNNEEIGELKEADRDKAEKREFLAEQRELGHNHSRGAFAKKGWR